MLPSRSIPSISISVCVHVRDDVARHDPRERNISGPVCSAPRERVTATTTSVDLQRRVLCCPARCVFSVFRLVSLHRVVSRSGDGNDRLMDGVQTFEKREARTGGRKRGSGNGVRDGQTCSVSCQKSGWTWNMSMGLDKSTSLPHQPTLELDRL
jgi:hypothetical protein